ncbi:MAG: hypothetical protein K0S71_328 [Clostridia bacterium]|jgi:TP901-1 family phage major tail protein|nr:hypothetical protein [Clostridia bacterium]
MSNKVAGVDVLVKVETTTGVYMVVGGQTGATMNRSASTIDVTNKQSGGWVEIVTSLKEWSIDFDGFVILGDAGIEAIETAFEDNKKVKVEVRVGATDDANGYTLSGEGFITDFPIEMPQDNCVTYSLSVAGASPLNRAKGIEA